MMLPFERNLRFVGRQSELRHLEDNLSLPDGPRKIAIAGLGGVGKTQIALELAYRTRDRDPDCSIFWIPCTSYEAVEHTCLTIAEMLGIKVKNLGEAKQQLDTYFSQAATKWLLIFDNADDTHMWNKGTETNPPLREFLPSSKDGHVVFTTRNRELAVDLVSSDIVDVRELDEKSGVEFLEKALRRDVPHDSHAMADLLEQLEFLPLAISQATAYINKKGIAVSDYLELLREQEEDVVDLLSREFSDERRYKDMQNPVAKTWLISFTQIEKLNSLAAEYLQLVACVSPRDIPRSLLPPASKLQMADALGLLTAYSLITTNPGNKDITLHRLVHLAIRKWLRNENRYALYITKIADRLREVFPDNELTNRQLWRSYLPHALFLLDDKQFREREEQYTDFMQKLGTCLETDGKFLQAEQLFRQVLKLRERLCGPRHPDTLETMNYIVLSYMTQRKWKEAEHLGVSVIEDRQVVLGPEHPDTLISMANLASTYLNRERWKEAALLGAQVLKTRRQVLGSLHPDTLTSMANLAGIYQAQARWEEAEALGVEVVAARKQVLGPEHPATVNCMSYLAAVYQAQKKYKEAAEVGLQVVKSMQETLGPEHPSTLIAMHHLASTYHEQGRWQEAEELEVQVLEHREELLGHDHPSTLLSLSRLASIFSMQGRLEEAEKLGAQVAKTQEELLGKEHPLTLSTWLNLVPNYQAQGRWNEAAELGARIVKVQEQVLGPRHPDTIQSMCTLGITYQHLDKWTEAEELERKVFEHRKEVLGLENPHTLDSIAILAYICQDRQRWTEAEELGVQLVECRRRLLGPEHPTTLMDMYSLAFSLKYLEKTSEALSLMRQCADLRVKILGSDHKDTKSAFRMLGYWETDIANTRAKPGRQALKTPFERFYMKTKSGTVRERLGLTGLFERH
jgi:tetratricopeptide (TPR) repeat protein